MKIAGVIGGLLIAFVFSAFIQWPSSPLTGKLQSVTVRVTSYPGRHRVEKIITIQDPAALAVIEKSMRTVWNHLAPNSNEGFPKYHMDVVYVDGRTQKFYFSRGEWGGSGATPPALLRELEKQGL
jgi:hypothetical protein